MCKNVKIETTQKGWKTVRLNEPTKKKTGADRLSLLYRISQTINSSLDLDRVMEVLMDEVISATNAERGFLMILGEDNDLQFRTARGAGLLEWEN